MECGKAACLQALDQAGKCKRKREHLTWILLLIISRGRASWLLSTIGQFCIEVVLGLRIVPLPPFQFRLNQGLIAILLIPLELLCRICSGERATIIFVSQPKLPHFACRWVLRFALWATLLRSLVRVGVTTTPPSASILSGAFRILTPNAGCNCTCGDSTPTQDAGTSFGGESVICVELDRARMFNTEVMPNMHGATYASVRRTMSNFGLGGHNWHVGHACSDTNKVNKYDHDDHGWNLFEQYSADNMRLGHCQVSCSEAAYLGAAHVNCTRSHRCLVEC